MNNNNNFRLFVAQTGGK